MKFVDITGMKFNRLTVLRRSDTNKDGHPAWVCRCDCGNETVVLGKYLKNGKIKSCGCYKKEQNKSRFSEYNKSLGKECHGQSTSRLYAIWCSMKSRCSEERGKAYKDYGGRGIKVCEEWKNSFECFRNWAMTNGYMEFLTIDRIDVNKGYFPENCRWVDVTAQNRNKRNNVKVCLNGETKCLAEWCEIFGISQSLVWHRVSRFNWSYEKAIKTPPRKPSMITINGVTKPEKEWCEEMGMSRRLFRYRRKKLNLSPEEAILRPVNKKLQSRKQTINRKNIKDK